MAHSVHREIEILLPKLTAFARYLTKDAADADDLVQASVERALRKVNQFTPGTNLKAWLFTIMRNVHINEIRSRARRGTTTDAMDCEELFPVAASQDSRLEVRDFLRAYEGLADTHQKIIDLVGIDGHSYQEAAVMLNVPVGTVRSRLSRARAHLSSILDPVHDDIAAVAEVPAPAALQ
jgi:RNA polymerase sigma-70 factor (ECF subfamily)